MVSFLQGRPLKMKKFSSERFYCPLILTKISFLIQKENTRILHFAPEELKRVLLIWLFYQKTPPATNLPKSESEA
jgi:hypothetical protein